MISEFDLEISSLWKVHSRCSGLGFAIALNNRFIFMTKRTLLTFTIHCFLDGIFLFTFPFTISRSGFSYAIGWRIVMPRALRAKLEKKSLLQCLGMARVMAVLGWIVATLFSFVCSAVFLRELVICWFIMHLQISCLQISHISDLVRCLQKNDFPGMGWTIDFLLGPVKIPM